MKFVTVKNYLSKIVKNYLTFTIQGYYARSRHMIGEKVYLNFNYLF